MFWSVEKEVNMDHVLRSAIKWLMIFTVTFAVTACGGRYSPIATPKPTVTPALEPTRLTSFIIGKLVAEEGCLRIIDKTSSTSYLIAWPPDFQVRTEQDQVKIIKRNGEEVILRIGEEIRMGGGEVGSRDFLGTQVQQSLPKQCLGPYWVAGLEVSPVKATQAPD